MHQASLPPVYPGTIEGRRALYDELLSQLHIPQHVAISSVEIDGRVAFWVDATGGTAQRAAVMLHGGGHWIGSAKGYQAHAAYVSYATNSRVLVPEYPLAPEHPYPAAIECALASVNEAAQQFGSASTFVFGDSSGGGLTLSALLAMHEHGLPRVAAAVLVCPWPDLSIDTEDPRWKTENEESADDLRRGLRRAARFYLGDRHPDEAPLAYPLKRDLGHLPPTQVLASTSDVLVVDARKLVAKLRQDGVETEYVEFSDMLHVWTLFSAFLPEGQKALADVSRFIDRHLNGGPGRGLADISDWIKEPDIA